MMISARVRYGKLSIDVYMPCSDQTLYLQLRKLHMSDPENVEVFVEKVTAPEGLAMLNDRFVNLDELNYLAKRLDSYETETQVQIFLAAAQAKGFCEMKDLINLTFQLSRYTLAPQTESLTVEGRLTDYGVLFENEAVPAQEFYDGQVFPSHLEDCMAAVKLHYGEKNEYVCFPCNEISVRKAVKRLGALRVEDCDIKLMDIAIQNPMWSDCFQEILSADGIYELNRTIQQFEDIGIRAKWNALAALMETKDSQTLRALIKKQETLEFLPLVQTPEELGRYWMKHVLKDRLSPAMKEFFQYDRFGEKIKRETGGRFLPDGGYLYPTEEKSLEEILDFSDDEEITMGGI